MSKTNRIAGSLLMILGALVWSGGASALTQTATPTTCSDVTGIGTVTWNNPNDAVSSNDVYASATVSGSTTHYLRCTGYGFSIPIGSTINGITVSVERKASSSGNWGANDAAMRIVKAGVIGNTDFSTGTTYPNIDTVEDHGSATELWGETWTAADINATNFGAALAATRFAWWGAAITVTVDVIQITVDYTPPSPVAINTYYPGTASVGVGAVSIPLGTATGATTPISAGDLVIIMQMQDATLDSTNTATYGDGGAGDPGSGATSVGGSGLYEYAVAANSVPLGGGTLSLNCGTVNAYTNAAATSTRGQRRFQVIRVPVFASYTLGAVTAQAWNGSTGGVLAFDVSGTLNLNSATVSVDGKGFRGGGVFTSTSGSGAYTDYRTPAASNGANGSKGEGIAGTPYYVFTPPGTLTNTGVEGYPNGSRARGAPGNAGGGATDRNPAANDQNPGGGGGGNGGNGGIGGIGWCPGFNTTPPYYGCGYAALASAVNPNGSTGGFGGAAVTGLGATRLTLGGGGGGGTANNVTGSGDCAAVNGLCTSGVSGGGIVMIRAGSMTGTATISANGSDGDTTVGNDGSGGAGAGGAVLISAGSGMGGVTISAHGGTGGSNLLPPDSGVTPHGPGGGGGGGYVLTSAAPAGCNIAGGASGVTYNNGAYFGGYGATAGTAGSCVSTLNSALIPGSGVGGVPACPGGVDHFLIDIGGASASTCAAKRVTISARDAANNVITTYVGTINITTSSGHGNWTIGSALGTLSNGVADDGAASYTYATLDSGVAPLDLSNTHADDLTVSVVDSTKPASLSTSSTISFRDSAFVVTPDPIQIAGRNQLTTVSLYTRVGGSCTIDANYTGAKNLDAWLTLDTDNPAGAIVPTIGALTLPTSAPASNPASNNLALTFTNGTATFNLGTTDVGKYVLNLRDDTRTYANAVDLAGSSASITTRPWLNVAVPGNPGANTSGGTIFTSAGTGFTVNVRGVLWQAADDTNNDGVPDAGANLADNTVAPHFAWATTLAPAAPFTPATSYDTPPGTATAGSVANGSFAQSSFSGGSASRSDVSYSEVGSFTLAATAANYLNSPGVNATGSVTPVGRFTPAYFLVSRSHGCVNATNPALAFFTYSGQPFAAVTVTARNAGGATTRNYDGTFGFAKSVALSDAGGFAGGTFTNGTFSAAGFVSGAQVKTDVSYTFSAKETAPVTLTLRATDTPDNVSSSAGPAGSEPNDVVIRSGRITLINAYGSELAPLPVPMRVEYYTADGWVTNTADTCTSIPATSLTLANNVAPSPVSPPTAKTVGTKTTTVTVAHSKFFDGSGDAGLSCSAPGSGGVGYVDITPDLSAMTWLRYDWSGTSTDTDPTGKATFGTYQGNPRHIYLREIY
jgi:Family of unknown function (DUF6701)